MSYIYAGYAVTLAVLGGYAALLGVRSRQR